MVESCYLCNDFAEYLCSSSILWIEELHGNFLARVNGYIVMFVVSGRKPFITVMIIGV